MTRLLPCQDIWGGNAAVDAAIATPGLDIWVHSRPVGGSEEGGDLYYASLCDGGRLTRVALADVSGHGPQVSPVAEDLRRLMAKGIANPDQSDMVRALNRRFTKLGREGRFATAAIVSFVAPQSHLVVVNAGHPPLLFRSAATGEWDWLTAGPPDAGEVLTDLPLGVIHPTEYRQFAAPFLPGDITVLYTDALLPGSEGCLLDAARRLDPERPEGIADALEEAVLAARCGAAPEDDLTIIVLRQNGGGASLAE
jgi:serine phosphatase RsbU (regulator of sigma subunit)